MTKRIVASTPVYELEHVEIIRDVHFIVLVSRQPEIVIEEVSIAEYPADRSAVELCEMTH